MLDVRESLYSNRLMGKEGLELEKISLIDSSSRETEEFNFLLKEGCPFASTVGLVSQKEVSIPQEIMIPATL